MYTLVVFSHYNVSFRFSFYKKIQWITQHDFYVLVFALFDNLSQYFLSKWNAF